MLSVKIDNNIGLYLLLISGALLGAIYVWQFLSSDLNRNLRFVLLRLARLLVVALLCLVLSDPYIETSGRQENSLVLVDISESMEAEVAQRLLLRSQELFSKERTPLFLPFSGQPAAAAHSPGVSDFRTLRERWGELDLGQTDIEQALRAAINADDISSIFLVSDGFETKGSVKDLGQLLESQFPPIFPLVVEDLVDGPQSFILSKLHAPIIAAANSSVEVRISIENTTTATQSGLLQVTHADSKLLAKEISVEPGQVRVVTVDSDPSKEGINQITAVLNPFDQRISASSQTTFITGQSRERVLLLSAQAIDQRFLKQALSEQAYQLDARLASQNSPVDLPDLHNYSVVILNNIPLNHLHPSAPLRLQQFVKEEGGGLIMIGGGQSFGLGGYRGSPVADILPVNPLPPQTEQKRLNTAIALVLDKSGSMRVDDRMEFTREAAKEVVRNLKDDDYVSVIAFDAAPFVVLRLAPVRDVRNIAANRIDRIIASGRTILLPAMDEARRALVRAQTARKHMIILTDGKLPGEAAYFIEMVKQARLQGISVSTVLVGGEVDDGLLKAMADYGGGAFYHTLNPRSLPRIFLRDVQIAAGELTVQEQTEYQVRTGSGRLQSTSLQSFPMLRGFVKTELKPAANLELIVQGATESDPLLASWQYGKGRALAFTSDANCRWSSAWINWGRFHQFWLELISSLRPEDSSITDQIQFDLRTHYAQGAINFDMAVYADIGGSALVAMLQQPDEEKVQINFNRRSKDRYHATLSTTLPGRYELLPSVSDKQLAPVAFYLSGDHFGENKWQGFNLPLLSWIAEKSGGRINPAREELEKNLPARAVKKQISNWLMLAAMVVFLLEILARQVWRWN